MPRRRARHALPLRQQHRRLVVRLLASLSMVAGVLAVPAITPTASLASTSDCVLKPERRDATVNQGLGSYANLVRGKETLVRLYLSEPAACNGTGSVYLTGTGSAKVFNGSDATSVQLGTGTLFSPLSKQALPNPYTTEPPANAAHDPIFVLPPSSLVNTTALGFTARIELTLNYTTSVSNAVQSVTFTLTKPVAQKTNALRILLQPLGDGTKTASEQYAYTTDPGNTTYVSTEEVVESAFQSLSRQFPVSGGVTPTLDGAVGSGGLRWGVAPSVLDIKSLPGAHDGTGFCIGSEQWLNLEPGLMQMLLTWNADNPDKIADRIMGVIDSRIYSDVGCWEGAGGLDGTTSFAVARPDGDSGSAKVSPTGGIMGMELTHNYGLRISSDTNVHSPNTHADVNSPNRAYNVTTRKFLPHLENHSTMLYLHEDSYYTEDNTLLEEIDQHAVLCALGGPAAVPCGSTGTGGTTFGVAAGPTFFMSGSTNGTHAGTSVVESYFSLDAPRCEPAATERSNTCAPSAESPYRLLQVAGQSPDLLANQGVAVSVAHDSHTHGLTGDTTNDGHVYDDQKTFSIAFEGYSAGRIQLWYCPPTLPDLAGCKNDPRTTGTLLYTRDKQASPPNVTSTTVTRGGEIRQATNNPNEADWGASLSYDGDWLVWSRICDVEAVSPCVDGAYVAPVSNPEAMVALPDAGDDVRFPPLQRNPEWNPAGDAIVYADPWGKQLYLQPVDVTGRSVTFGKPFPLLTADEASPEPDNPTFSQDGREVIFGYGGDIARIRLDAAPALPQPLVATDAEESAPSASRTPGDRRIAYQVQPCTQVPGTDGGSSTLCLPHEVHSVDDRGEAPRMLAKGTSPSYGDDGRIVFVDGDADGLASVDSTGADERPLTNGVNDFSPTGSTEGLIAFSRDGSNHSVEIFLINQSQYTVTSTVTSPVAELLVSDLIYECLGTRYPVAVGVRPASVTAGEATFSAVFDPSLACGAAEGRLFFSATDGIDRTAGTTTAQQLAVAAKNPSAGIHAPREGEDLGPLATLVLDGGGHDAEGQDVNETLAWRVTTSDGTTFDAGTGQHVDLPAPAGGWPAGTVTVSLTATDSAGATGTSTRTVLVRDTAAPDLRLSHRPDGLAGWHRSSSVDVTVTGNDADSTLASLVCDDAGSALQPSPELASDTTYAGTVSVTGEGAHLIRCTLTDAGGNATTVSEIVRIDSVAPALSSQQSPAANPNGWNDGDVSVSFSCADTTSGVTRLDATGAASGSSTSSPLMVSVTSEGAAQPVDATCEDAAGNIGTRTHAVSIDKTPPTITVTAPFSNEMYAVGQYVETSYSCDDALSGIASCTGPAVLDTSTTGSKTATFIAVDRAGHTTTVTVTYKVSWIFEGFLKPVENQPTVNSGKAGRTYPVKWRLKTADGTYLTELSAIEALRYTPVSCADWLVNPLNALDTWSSGSSKLRNSDGTYTYDWQTPSTPGCYVLHVVLADGIDTTYSANFSLGVN